MSDNIKYIFKEKEYLSDEALEQLIAEVEAEPLMHPPKDFKNEILQKLRRKRKHRKDAQLFLYSIKVVAASAAALLILITVPQNIYSQENVTQRSIEHQVRVKENTQRVSEKERTFEQNITYNLNRKVNGYFGELNDKLNQWMKMEVIDNEKEEK